jgi:hypothetical protein
MQLQKIFLSLAMLLVIPTVASAGEIDLKAGNVRINTSSRSDIYVNTGSSNRDVYLDDDFDDDDIKVSDCISKNRSRYNTRNRRYINLNNSKHKKVYTRQTTRINGSGRTVIQSNSTYNSR